jgi:hypothetical protein
LEETVAADAAPERTDWRVALRAYVSGHDRGGDADVKLDDARRAAAVQAMSARAPAREASEAGASETRAGEGVAVRPPLRVPVPDRLDFHRGAGTWRRHLPSGRHVARATGHDDPAG